MAASRLHLFQAFGIELEYMITDTNTGAVAPLAAHILRDEQGEVCDEITRGEVALSNELVSHVVELKSAKPMADLVALHKAMNATIAATNAELGTKGARLMSGAAHPTMNPLKETVLWPYGNKDIYSAYDRIFGCKGHGWSNLQSMHINLPFYDDSEFAPLHAAIRVVLPILPALAASSPVLDGKLTGYADTRLHYYQKNQQIIPEIVGKVIPERVNGRAQYRKFIYEPIAEAVAAHDPEGILDPVWVNSRGAIARFDRGSVEIRVLDLQECPGADLGIAVLVIQLLKDLMQAAPKRLEAITKAASDPLAEIFRKTVHYGGEYTISNSEYLHMLGIEAESMKASDVWKALYDRTCALHPEVMEYWKPWLDVIIQEGTLSSRITKAMEQQDIATVYASLCDCLAHDRSFRPS